MTARPGSRTWLTFSLDDLDIALVGPGGQVVMLMSDAGGTPQRETVFAEVAKTHATPMPPISECCVSSSGLSSNAAPPR